MNICSCLMSYNNPDACKNCLNNSVPIVGNNLVVSAWNSFTPNLDEVLIEEIVKTKIKTRGQSFEFLNEKYLKMLIKDIVEGITESIDEQRMANIK